MNVSLLAVCASVAPFFASAQITRTGAASAPPAPASSPATPAAVDVCDNLRHRVETHIFEVEQAARQICNLAEQADILDQRIEEAIDLVEQADAVFQAALDYLATTTPGTQEHLDAGLAVSEALTELAHLEENLTLLLLQYNALILDIETREKAQRQSALDFEAALAALLLEDCPVTPAEISMWARRVLEGLDAAKACIYQ